MKVILSLSSNKYYYGMRVRPFSIGTQPKGHSGFIDTNNVPSDILKRFKEPDFRFGILIYPRELTANEVEHYSLTDLNIDHEADWRKFKEFAERMVEYGVEYDQFEEDYIHPRGSLRSENPLHEMPVNDFFKLLENKGYPGRLAGLKKFYSSL